MQLLIKLRLDKKRLYRKNTIMETKSAPKSYTLTADELRLTKIMKALGHPARMQIIRYLGERPQCFTGDIVDVLPLAQATVSQHLKVLRDAGLICGNIEGPATSYCLDEDTLKWLQSKIGDLANIPDGSCC